MSCQSLTPVLLYLMVFIILPLSIWLNFLFSKRTQLIKQFSLSKSDISQKNNLPVEFEKKNKQFFLVMNVTLGLVVVWIFIGFIVKYQC